MLDLVWLPLLGHVLGSHVQHKQQSLVDLRPVRLGSQHSIAHICQREVAKDHPIETVGEVPGHSRPPGVSCFVEVARRTTLLAAWHASGCLLGGFQRTHQERNILTHFVQQIRARQLVLLLQHLHTCLQEHTSLSLAGWLHSQRLLRPSQRTLWQQKCVQLCLDEISIHLLRHCAVGRVRHSAVRNPTSFMQQKSLFHLAFIHRPARARHPNDEVLRRVCQGRHVLAPQEDYCHNTLFRSERQFPATPGTNVIHEVPGPVFDPPLKVTDS